MKSFPLDSSRRPASECSYDLGRNGLPLVSCIMLTADRPRFAAQAVAYFGRQDYSRRELLILDDGRFPVDSLAAGRQDVRYFRLQPGLSLGEKRNRACAEAKGRIIVHWDDDDWFGEARLRRQVLPIIQNQADMTGLSMTCIFDVRRWEFWKCSPRVHRCMLIGDLHGGTLAYSKTLYDDGLRFMPISLAEDTYFLLDAKKRFGARVLKLLDDDVFVYVRHGSNAWQFECGRHIDAEGWHRGSAPEHLQSDLAFYAALYGGDDSQEAFAVSQQANSTVMKAAGMN